MLTAVTLSRRITSSSASVSYYSIYRLPTLTLKYDIVHQSHFGITTCITGRVMEALRMRLGLRMRLMMRIDDAVSVLPLVDRT